MKTNERILVSYIFSHDVCMIRIEVDLKFLLLTIRTVAFLYQVKGVSTS